MTGHDLACLVADARRDISDADRCLMLHVEPSVGQLHRRLREVTDALDALSTPPADDVREALGLVIEEAINVGPVEGVSFAGRIADAVLAAPGIDFRPHGTVTDAAVEAGALAIFAEEQCDRHQKATSELIRENWAARLTERDQDEYRSLSRAALEAAQEVRP